MIDIAHRVALSPEETRDLDGLVSACVSLDGYSKLETEKSLNAHKEMPSFFLARDVSREVARGLEDSPLVGALSIFAPRSDEAELGALVLPAYRRRGVFAALVGAAEETIRGFGYSSELFVVDGRSEAGRAAAAALGAAYEYTEYAMRYEAAAAENLGGDAIENQGGEAPGLVVSRLGKESISALVRLRADAFEDSLEDAEAFERSTFAAANRQVYGAFLGKELVGACSLGFEGRSVSVNGLVIEKKLRGRGFGQAFLSEIVAMLRAGGYEILLEVNSENANAFHVYKKLGFAVLTSVEYYRRALR
jgi:ribosomal protein S18 acetylase RimI-like enzyme